MREPEEKYFPVAATLEVPGPFKVESQTMHFGPRLVVATQPAGEDAIKLVWEINDRFPPGDRNEILASVFTGEVDALAGKTFRIMASRDGKEFEEVGSVAGPANSFVHEGVIPNRAYYYKIVASDSDATKCAESDVTLGAAGRNLLAFSDFEARTPGALSDPMPEGASVSGEGVFSVMKGARPWSSGRRILKVDVEYRKDPTATLCDGSIELSADKAFVHGAWLRSPGRGYACLGRDFHDEEAGLAFYTHSLIVNNHPSWVFSSQLITCDPESLVGNGRSLPTSCKWPKLAREMRSWLVFYGQAELDDMWIVEVEPPEGSAE